MKNRSMVAWPDEMKGISRHVADMHLATNLNQT